MRDKRGMNRVAWRWAFFGGCSCRLRNRDFDPRKEARLLYSQGSPLLTWMVVLYGWRLTTAAGLQKKQPGGITAGAHAAPRDRPGQDWFGGRLGCPASVASRTWIARQTVNRVVAPTRRYAQRRVGRPCAGGHRCEYRSSIPVSSNFELMAGNDGEPAKRQNGGINDRLSGAARRDDDARHGTFAPAGLNATGLWAWQAFTHWSPA